MSISVQLARRVGKYFFWINFALKCFLVKFVVFSFLCFYHLPFHR